MNTLEVRNSLSRGSGHSTTAQALLELSHKMASEDNAWGAVATQIAADMALLDQILGDDSNTLNRAVLRLGEGTTAGVSDSLGVITSIRDHTIRNLSQDSAAAYILRLDDASHLKSLALPTSEDIDRGAERRLRGSGAPERVKTLREYAHRFYGAARALRALDRSSDAFRATYRADLATFEATSIELAVSSGDWSLMTANVRWDLACWTLEQLEDTPAYYQTAVEQVRGALEWAMNSHPDAIRWEQID